MSKIARGEEQQLRGKERESLIAQMPLKCIAKRGASLEK